MCAGDVTERSKILRLHPQGRYDLHSEHEPSVCWVNLGDYWWVTSASADVSGWTGGYSKPKPRRLNKSRRKKTSGDFTESVSSHNLERDIIFADYNR